MTREQKQRDLTELVRRELAALPLPLSDLVTTSTEPANSYLVLGPLHGDNGFSNRLLGRQQRLWADTCALTRVRHELPLTAVDIDELLRPGAAHPCVTRFVTEARQAQLLDTVKAHWPHIHVDPIPHLNMDALRRWCGPGVPGPSRLLLVGNQATKQAELQKELDGVQIFATNLPGLVAAVEWPLSILAVLLVGPAEGVVRHQASDLDVEVVFDHDDALVVLEERRGFLVTGDESYAAVLIKQTDPQSPLAERTRRLLASDD